jgi:hypothetical protein
MMTLALTKALGTPPEPFDGSSTKAEAFWTNLANYYYLNNDLYSTSSQKIAFILTYFKLGTPAKEWAKDKQQAALAMTHPDFGSWTDFQDAFKAHFIPSDAKLLSIQQMHFLKMGNRPFTNWYQESSTHTSQSGANNETKMYAFHQNLPSALHNKILRVSLAPTTLNHLVQLAKEFDQTWQMYNNEQSSTNLCHHTNVHTITTNDPNATNINLTNFPPRDTKFKKLSKEEKDKHRYENHCMYCGETGHWQDHCLAKPAHCHFSQT